MYSPNEGIQHVNRQLGDISNGELVRGWFYNTQSDVILRNFIYMSQEMEEFFERAWSFDKSKCKDLHSLLYVLEAIHLSVPGS